MKWKAYPAYQNTKVLWLGDLPDHWKVRRIKHTTYVKGRIGWQGLRSDEFIDEGPYLVTGTDFLNGRINWNSCYHVSYDRYSEDPYIHLQEGDLLITKDGSIGKVAIVKDLPGKATLNSGIFLTRQLSKLSLSEFIYWVLNSKIFTNFINITKAGSTISHLYQNVFVEFAFPIPTLEEQQSISTFLNRETERIDTLIAKKERQIELLEEKRIALISNAVTKGLNPDVEMKDSGIEWLGEIPRDWEAIRLKHVSSHIVDCQHSTPVYSEDGLFPAIRTADVIPGVLDLGNAKRVTEEEYKYRISRLKPKGGDIVYSREGERFGIAALVPDNRDICLSQRMMMFRCKHKMALPAFLMWQLNGKAIYRQAEQDVIGATSPHVNVETIRNFWLAMPKYEEQHKIASYIDKEVHHIDSLHEHIQMSIQKLHEYRGAIISAAVTGKIAVSQEVA